LARARIPSGGATELILRLLKLKENTQDVDAPFFYYPKTGFGGWPAKLAEGLVAAGGRVLTATTPVAIEKQGERAQAVVVEKDGTRTRLECATLVSSVTLPALGGLLFPGDREVEEECRSLRFRDLALVYLILRQDRLTDDHWIFFPERRYPFNRLFEQKAMNPALGPEGKTALCCDITFEPGDDVARASDDELVRRCFAAVVEAGLTTEDKLETGFVRRFKSFYPMYTVGYRNQLDTVYRRLRGVSNLLLTGRLGMFNYNNSDHCLDMGRFIANELALGRRPPEVWSGLEDRVRSYRIVD